MLKGRDNFCLCDRQLQISDLIEFNYVKAYIAEKFTSHSSKNGAGDCLKQGSTIHLDFIGFILEFDTLEETKSSHTFIEVVRFLEQRNMK